MDSRVMRQYRVVMTDSLGHEWFDYAIKVRASSATDAMASARAEFPGAFIVGCKLVPRQKVELGLEHVPLYGSD